MAFLKLTIISVPYILLPDPFSFSGALGQSGNKSKEAFSITKKLSPYTAAWDAQDRARSFFPDSLFDMRCSTVNMRSGEILRVYVSRLPNKERLKEVDLDCLGSGIPDIPSSASQHESYYLSNLFLLLQSYYLSKESGKKAKLIDKSGITSIKLSAASSYVAASIFLADEDYGCAYNLALVSWKNGEAQAIDLMQHIESTRVLKSASSSCNSVYLERAVF